MRIEIGSEIIVRLLQTDDLGFGSNLIGAIGQSLYTNEDYDVLKNTQTKLSITFHSGTVFTVKHRKEEDDDAADLLDCYDIQWECLEKTHNKLEDKFLMKDAYWYGGSAVLEPLWPLNRMERPLAAFVTGDSYVDKYGGVQERFWLSSKGVALFVNYDVPLFVSINENGDDALRFVSSFTSPYKNHRNKNLFLNYSICQGPNITSMFLSAAGRFWKKPFDIPDRTSFRYPIWSTWAIYKGYVNQTHVLQFAARINHEGFKNSHLEIDDGWAEHHGDFNFDAKKFPNPKGMVKSLKDNLGFRVTLWVHTFANLLSNAVWKRDSKGNRLWMTWWKMDFPAFGIWWDGIGALLDLSNPEARNWFREELDRMKKDYGIDSFKFDGGESSWMSSWARSLHPMDNINDYTKAFVDVAYKCDTDVRLQEVRAGVASQHLPIFTRVMDKDSHWRYDNGLRSLIPHILLFGIIGYPFVLPDMIGGNAYNMIFIHSTIIPDRELYIRWMEATALLPAMQFSVPPWHYDRQVVDIAHRMCNLHEKYSDKIVDLAEQSVLTGAPIIRPIWWIAPSDETALIIDTQFLVGDDVLVAPVLDKGSCSRDIYLPAGKWKDELRNGTLEGGRWYRNYKVEIDELAYFTKMFL